MNAAALQQPPSEIDDLPPVMLPYQQQLLASTAQVIVYEKSRRIGVSWAAAAAAVLASSVARSDGGMNTFYIGYEKEMTRGFIDDCAFWAKHFGVIAGEVDEFLFVEQDKDGERSIQAFRIRFASGFEVVALSSRPRNLRSRQGLVILDEAAFMDDLEEMLTAAFALLIWGGRVWIISTHKGADNPFNELVIKCRERKVPFELHRTTFDEALEQGLYKRICLREGRVWSPEAEAEFVAFVRSTFTDGGAEELDCIPSQSAGVYLTRALIEACATSPGPVLQLKCPDGFELRPKVERRSYVAAWLEQNVAPELAKLDKRLRHAWGHDYARSGHISCFVPLVMERDLRRTVPFVIEMRNVPYDQQKQVLWFTIGGLPNHYAGKVDGTGPGAPLGEEAVQRFGGGLVESVTLSQGWYLTNMPPVKAALEDRILAILRSADHVDDLRQIQLIKGVAMVPKDAETKGSDGGLRHGDFAVGLALALAASASSPTEYGYLAVRRLPANPALNNDDDDDDAPGSVAQHLRREGTC